jgi:hypothetical protein
VFLGKSNENRLFIDNSDVKFLKYQTVPVYSGKPLPSYRSCKSLENIPVHRSKHLKEIFSYPYVYIQDVVEIETLLIRGHLANGIPGG